MTEYIGCNCRTTLMVQSFVLVGLSQKTNRSSVDKLVWVKITTSLGLGDRCHGFNNKQMVKAMERL